MTPPLDLERIKILHAATTPNWHAGRADARDLYEGDATILCLYELGKDRVLFSANAHFPYEADVKFAVAAHEFTPALIEAVERLEAENRRLRMDSRMYRTGFLHDARQEKP